MYPRITLEYIINEKRINNKPAVLCTGLIYISGP
jgi:hypothetical protein